MRGKSSTQRREDVNKCERGVRIRRYMYFNVYNPNQIMFIQMDCDIVNVGEIRMCHRCFEHRLSEARSVASLVVNGRGCFAVELFQRLRNFGRLGNRKHR